MNTKIVMTSSALMLGLIGLTLTFIPTEILIYFKLEPSLLLQILLQLLGALYFGFAMLNWMSKTSLIGGIYNRPTAIANMAHSLIGGLALIKGFSVSDSWPMVLTVITIIYTVYAIFFALILFRHPMAQKENE